MKKVYKSASDYKVAKEVAEILLDIGSVIFRPQQPFKFDSGILSPVYVDNRLLISMPRERELIIKYLVDTIRKIGVPDVVAGVATAGITHAAWIAQKLNLPMVYVRAKPKDHGRQNQVEGRVKRGQKVLIVEDMVSTAGSSTRVIEALRKLGARINDEVAIYTHNFTVADRNFQKAKVKFHPLTNLNEVIQVAVSQGFLKPEQAKIIFDWTKDPKNWANRQGFE
ncbi:orotate phosphoribosyltransferase [Candidatus Curtissbacteria bacterium RIFCSPHIGHO2_02_39_8]|nr:MAG: orotate phosphoribosyltransferase [Candidatus Curtissbacteria bacterium RIFCSPHIGHO2_02_39_8]